VELVVADANVLLAGLIDPSSLCRKLLVVFAWAKAHEDLRDAEAYREEVEQLIVEHPGARFGGAPSPDQVVEQAETRVAVLEEHLPAMTPTGFGLVTSKAITTEVYDIAVGGRSGFGPVSKELARGAVAAAVAISAIQQVTGLDGAIPAYTEGRDVKDDPIIHTAILAGAEWVLSQDRRHVALNWKRPTAYTNVATGRATGAIGLNYFITKRLCTGLHFDEDALRSIDGRVLDHALRPLAG
jgi:predicted nucleic acid-binding protein